ncbi:hypothetical protein N7504_010537 [Penicillium tannophilum]|nr:hypothetical protein N7504_010537 [Penicillium tannophilum]
MDWDRRRFDDRRGGKVIDRLTDQVGRPREDTTLDTDVRLLGIDLVYVVTLGCHLVEAMDVQEVVLLPITGVAPEPLPSRAEVLGLVRTGEGVLLLDDSLRGERIDPDPLFHHGAPSLLTAKDGRVTYLVAAAAQGAIEMHPPGVTICAQFGGLPLPKVRPSPSHTLPRRDLPPDLSRARPFPQSRPVSPVHVARPDSSTTSRRSSPVTGPDRRPAASRKSRSRSPIRSSPRRPSGLSGAQFYRDRDSTRHPEAIHSERGPSNADRPESELSEPVQSRSGSHIPTQPRNTGIRQSPPSGPSHGPKTIPSQPRGSHNTSFLSAPTRPRRGPPGSRDGPWPSAPMARRGPSMTAPHPTPSGPRASFTPPVPGGNFRHPGSRQNSTAPVVSSSPVSKPPNHLVGLYTLIPGGRTLPSALDGATEKRLSQLESDQEKLLEQMAESQRLKRAGLRDWDRLDHESSICALKSDLAEGHLQRMADEAIGGGIPF